MKERKKKVHKALAAAGLAHCSELTVTEDNSDENMKIFMSALPLEIVALDSMMSKT